MSRPVRKLDPNSTFITRVLSEVQPKMVDWLWPHRIPRGHLTLLSGDPGVGKSSLTLDLAARVSRGSPWPDLDATEIDPADVILIGAEDSVESTVLPRLTGMNADLDRIRVVDETEVVAPQGNYGRPIDLVSDVSIFDKLIEESPNCRLIIIDPLNAFLTKVDVHRDNELRGVLHPLVKFAEATNVAILCVNHLNKSQSSAAIYRSMGSIGFMGAARSALMVATDPRDLQNPPRRLLFSVKNNLAKEPSAIAYRVESAPANEQALVSWDTSPIEVSLEEALEASSPRHHKNSPANRWLKDALTKKPRLSKAVFKVGKRFGYGSTTIRHSLKSLGGFTRKEPSMRGRTKMHLPEYQ